MTLITFYHDAVNPSWQTNHTQQIPNTKLNRHELPMKKLVSIYISAHKLVLILGSCYVLSIPFNTLDLNHGLQQKTGESLHKFLKIFFNSISPTIPWPLFQQSVWVSSTSICFLVCGWVKLGQAWVIALEKQELWWPKRWHLNWLMRYRERWSATVHVP